MTAVVRDGRLIDPYVDEGRVRPVDRGAGNDFGASWVSWWDGEVDHRDRVHVGRFEESLVGVHVSDLHAST